MHKLHWRWATASSTDISRTVRIQNRTCSIRTCTQSTNSMCYKTRPCTCTGPDGCLRSAKCSHRHYRTRCTRLDYCQSSTNRRRTVRTGRRSDQKTLLCRRRKSSMSTVRTLIPLDSLHKSSRREGKTFQAHTGYTCRRSVRKTLVCRSMQRFRRASLYCRDTAGRDPRSDRNTQPCRHSRRWKCAPRAILRWVDIVCRYPHSNQRHVVHTNPISKDTYRMSCRSTYLYYTRCIHERPLRKYE
jgi:hypothetical protein